MISYDKQKHINCLNYRWNFFYAVCQLLNDHCEYTCAGIEWSPRMDVAESESKYVITVEVPGVSISDIRVEVDDLK